VHQKARAEQEKNKTYLNRLTLFGFTGNATSPLGSLAPSLQA